MKITGKRRYRAKKRLFRDPLLVLQVEYRDMIVSAPGCVDPIFRWRDAKVEDLMIIQSCHTPFPVDLST